MRKFGDKRLGQIKKIEDDASIFFLLSDKRGSNPRPAAWEAAALPTELLSQTAHKVANKHP